MKAVYTFINYYENLPINWEITTLNNIGIITGGGTPKTEINEYWNGDITWITPADMSNKIKYIKDSRRKISILGLENSSAKLISSNSIIMSSRAPIGYLLINTIPVSTSQGCKSFTAYCYETINISYIYYYLLAVIDDIKKRGSGTTFKEISGSEFGNTLILIPPYDEQNRIAKKIEKLLNVI